MNGVKNPSEVWSILGKKVCSEERGIRRHRRETRKPEALVHTGGAVWCAVEQGEEKFFRLCEVRETSGAFVRRICTNPPASSTSSRSISHSSFPALSTFGWNVSKDRLRKTNARSSRNSIAGWDREECLVPGNRTRVSSLQNLPFLCWRLNVEGYPSLVVRAWRPQERFGASMALGNAASELFQYSRVDMETHYYISIVVNPLRGIGMRAYQRPT